MDNRLGEMQVFARVIEAGNLSAAARLLRMTPSMVSKLIGRLEARLGVRLLERSTRRLSPTEEGRLFYESSLTLLGEIEHMEQAVSQGAGSARGTMRVNASVGFGILGIEPLIPAFWQAHPNIVVDLSLSDEIVDLYLDRTDIAFRIGPLADSSLMAWRIGSTERRIVAAPSYLERHGMPRTIADLDDHNCLGFNFRRSTPVWPVRDGDRTIERTVAGSLLANNGDTVRRLAVAGLGLARLGEFHIRKDLAAGRLVEVLTEATLADREDIHALYLGGQRMPQRVRLLLDFLVPRLRDYIEGRG